MLKNTNLAETPKDNQEELAAELATNPEEKERLRINYMANEAAEKAGKTEHNNDTIFSK